MKKRFLSLGLALALFLTACGGVADPGSPNVPDPPAQGPLLNSPSVVIPGEVVSDAPQPRATMEIGGEKLQYENTMETDLTTMMNFQNAEIKDRELVYLNDKQDIYSFDETGKLLSFVRAEQVRGEDAPAPVSDMTEVEAAIQAAADFDIQVSEEQVGLCHGNEWGGYYIVFETSEDPRLRDQVIVSLDADYSLYSLVVQNSGISSIDEVDVEFFDRAFADYCSKLEAKPVESSVVYKRYGETITARYSMVLSDGTANWMENVSFADTR